MQNSVAMSTTGQAGSVLTNPGTQTPAPLGTTSQGVMLPPLGGIATTPVTQLPIEAQPVQMSNVQNIFPVSVCAWDVETVVPVFKSQLLSSTNPLNS